MGSNFAPSFPFTANNAVSSATVHLEFKTAPPFLLAIMKVITMTLRAPTGSCAHFWVNSPLPAGSKSLSYWIHTIFAKESQQASEHAYSSASSVHTTNYVLKLIRKNIFSEYISINNKSKSSFNSSRLSKSMIYSSKNLYHTTNYMKLPFTWPKDTTACNILLDIRIGAFEYRTCNRLYELRVIDTKDRCCHLCDRPDDSADHLAFHCTRYKICSLRTGPIILLLVHAHMLTFAAKHELSSISYLATILLLGGRLDNDTFLPDWAANTTSSSDPPPAIIVARFFHKALQHRKQAYFHIARRAEEQLKVRQKRDADNIIFNNQLNNIPCEICNSSEEGTDQDFYLCEV